MPDIPREPRERYPIVELSEKLFQHIVTFETEVRAFGQRMEAHAIAREDDPWLGRLDVHLTEIDAELTTFARQKAEELAVPIDRQLQPIDEKIRAYGDDIVQYRATGVSAWDRVNRATDVSVADKLETVSDTVGDVNMKLALQTSSFNGMIEARVNTELGILSRREELIRSNEDLCDRFESLLKERHELLVARLQAHEAFLKSKWTLLDCLQKLIKDFKEIV